MKHHARYIPALRERERAMLSVLSQAEQRRQFERLLDKLAGHVPQWSSVDEV